MHAVLCTYRLKNTFIYEFYIDLCYSGQKGVQCSVIQSARSCLCTAQKLPVHICVVNLLHISMGLASAGRGTVGAYSCRGAGAAAAASRSPPSAGQCRGTAVGGRRGAGNVRARHPLGDGGCERKEIGRGAWAGPPGHIGGDPAVGSRPRWRLPVQSVRRVAPSLASVCASSVETGSRPRGPALGFWADGRPLRGGTGATGPRFRSPNLQQRRDSNGAKGSELPGATTFAHWRSSDRMTSGPYSRPAGPGVSDSDSDCSRLVAPSTQRAPRTQRVPGVGEPGRGPWQATLDGSDAWLARLSRGSCHLQAGRAILSGNRHPTATEGSENLLRYSGRHL